MFKVFLTHYFRLHDYTPAMKFCQRVLEMEPGNQQATQLLEIIKKKRKKDAMIGAAVLGRNLIV